MDNPPVTRTTYPARGQHRLRVGRISSEGGAYFVTAVTAAREPILRNPAAARVVLTSIEWMEAQCRWEWWCAVVMPDPVHVAFLLTGPDTLAQLMKSFKGYTGSHINRALQRHGPVWQEAYFDHRIRSVEKSEQVAFYCFRNPVLKGWVPDGREWPFWICKPALWASVEGAYEDLMELERERRLWRPL